MQESAEQAAQQDLTKAMGEEIKQQFAELHAEVTGGKGKDLDSEETSHEQQQQQQQQQRDDQDEAASGHGHEKEKGGGHKHAKQSHKKKGEELRESGPGRKWSVGSTSIRYRPRRYVVFKVEICDRIDFALMSLVGF